MSSIYRKGRDGYYYYQTYVYNPDTGKKDKRIFHSLGTREMNQAEEKQVELDIQYEKQVAGRPSKSIFSFILGQRQSIMLIFLTVGVTVFIMNIFQNEPSPKHNLSKKAISAATIEENVQVQIKSQKLQPVVKKETKQKDQEKVLKQKPKPKIQIPSIPDYKIVRVDRLSGAFDQGKVYVTVKNKANTASLQLLCKNLTDQYKEFSNIVICIYDNSPAGEELAKGAESNYSIEEKNKAWLAMYSYNPVEGDYFDDKPGSYLGAY
tara:strand:- start:8032 stop:8823 length:792 start_codon:yes stop_codon:yes gene_type:complete